MIHEKSVLAVITARGGSKGVPKKNIRELGGKPLIAWTIESAQRSVHIDRLILSSDDPAIIDIATDLGCEVPFIRPPELATDEASSMAVLHHAIRSLNEVYDYVVLLQPTSPFRTTADIDGCIELCEGKNAPACVSVTECSKNPIWMYSLTENQMMQPIMSQENSPQRRQELPPVFELNGAVYVARTDWLTSTSGFVQTETLAYTMPKERSLDIDSEQDFLIAQFLIQKECYL